MKQLLLRSGSNRSLTNMPSVYPDIAARFREFKIGTGLTFADIAKTIGTSKESLQAYASGRVSPNFYTLRMLKKKFGLSYDWLIDGSEPSKTIIPLARKVEEIKVLLKTWDQ